MRGNDAPARGFALEQRRATAVCNASEATLAPERRLAPRPDIRQWRTEAIVMLREISATADAMTMQGFDAESNWGRRADWRLLQALDRIHGTPSIADLARVLHVSRQTTHELVRRAEKDGFVEVLQNRHDRRIRQIRLTAGGRTALAWARNKESEWAIELLNGLDIRTIHSTSRILRVLRQRLLARRP